MLWTLIAAGGLVSIPVLIHIFNRTRYRRIQWAAMEFLLAAYKRTRRRMQFENLLLLILRCLAMLFLAFAFVPDGINPAADATMDAMGISLAQTAEKGSAQHLIVVVDDSASMRYLSADGNRTDAYDKALGHARRYIDALNRRRDKVTLIFPSSQAFFEDQNADAASSAISIREMTVETALATLEAHKATYGRADLLQTLAQVRERVALVRSNNETPQVLVVSDFQKNEWAFTAREDTDYQRAVNLLDEINRELTDVGSKMVFVNALARDSRERENLGIVSLELVTDIVGVGMPIEIRARILNAGSEEKTDVLLEFQLDSTGIRRFDAPIKIPAGETIEVKQEIGRFNTAGAHRVMVRIAKPARDDFMEDNQANLAVTALDEVPILVVDGEPKSAENEDGEVELLALALQVNEVLDEEGNTKERLTPNKITVIEAQGITANVLKRASVIVVANANKLSQSAIKLLEDRVAAGGSSLFLTLGDQVDAQAFNANLFKNGLGLAPARLTKVLSFDDGKGDDELPEFLKFVLEDRSQDSPFKNLNDELAEMFTEERGIAKWFGCELPQDIPAIQDGNPEEARVILTVEDGRKSPLLVTRPYGRGMVAMFTSSIDPEWNALWNVGSWPLFRLSHEVINMLSGVDSRGRSLRVGDRIVQDVPLHPAGYSMDAPQEGISTVSQTEVDKTTVRILFDETYIPGVYTLKPTDTSVAGEGSTHYFSVSIAEEESDTRVLGNNPDSAKSIASVMNSLVEDFDAIDFEEEERSSAEIAGSQGDREMDRWLLFIGLAILCMLGEIALTMITGRRAEA